MEAASFKHLEVGRKYRVIRAFTDFDGQLHPVDETWRFRGTSFLPYDNGLSLFDSTKCRDGDWRDTQIRMRWADEDQGGIIDALADYLQTDLDESVN